MRFRPCIDIHNGRVKQIVGGSLADQGDYAKENFVSDMDAKDYAALYKEKNATGGHIILLNKKDSEFYSADLKQAKEALLVYPGGLQIGGGVNDTNAELFIRMGASHVIVTSYVFSEGEIRFDRLEKLVKIVGKERIVLDLSCRKKDGEYFIVTDRWQKFTKQPINSKLLQNLSNYCDEFLVHAVDVEGMGLGPETELVELLADGASIPVTYAGGIGKVEDLELLKIRGKGKVDFTIGSALDIFGGKISFQEIVTKFL